MQVVEFVDVADIHLFLVQFRLIKVLGEKKCKCGELLNSKAGKYLPFTLLTCHEIEPKERIVHVSAFNNMFPEARGMLSFNTGWAQQDLATGCAGNVCGAVTTGEHILSDSIIFC